jgi:hypothetical protein
MTWRVAFIYSRTAAGEDRTDIFTPDNVKKHRPERTVLMQSDYEVDYFNSG